MTPQSAGGNARAATLSPERRREIACKAAKARWAKRRPKVAPRDMSELSDEKLLERAVRNARARGRGRQPCWVGVMGAFALGSTFAHQLCRRFGLDPDEMVRK